MLKNHYDVVLIGTDVRNSFLSAHYSKLNLNVIHIDSNSYYGGKYSSVQCKDMKSHLLKYFKNVSIDGDETMDCIVETRVKFIHPLKNLSKSISSSSMSEYLNFTRVSGPFYDVCMKKIPTSKEDLFVDKDISLINKRNIMRLFKCESERL